MPHEKIQHYLQSIGSLVRKLKNVYVKKYEEEILTANRSNIRLKIRFQSGALLEINELPDHKHSLNAVAGCVRPKFNEVLDEAFSWKSENFL